MISGGQKKSLHNKCTWIKCALVYLSRSWRSSQNRVRENRPVSATINVPYCASFYPRQFYFRQTMRVSSLGWSEHSFPAGCLPPRPSSEWQAERVMSKGMKLDMKREQYRDGLGEKGRRPRKAEKNEDTRLQPSREPRCYETVKRRTVRYTHVAPCHCQTRRMTSRRAVWRFGSRYTNRTAERK